jgi:hypothetical protein
MAKSPRPIRSDTVLMDMVQKIVPSKGRIACLEAPVIGRFALMLRVHSLSKNWSDAAFSLGGKRHDLGTFDEPKMIWLFPNSAIPRLLELTPNMEVPGYERSRYKEALVA